MSTAILLGSSRSNGDTRRIVDFVAEHLDCTFFDLNNYQISYYDYTHDNSNDDFLGLMDQLLAFDHIIFASPVYWYSMSAQMKTFFDRISDLLTIRKEKGRQLRGKSMSVISCSSDAREYPVFFSPFQLSADYLGMPYIEQIHTWVEKEEIPLEVQQNLLTFVKNNKL